MSLLEEYEKKLSAGSKSLLKQVKASFENQSLKEDVYDKFLKDNRIHQNDALAKLQNETKGQVIIPTGTGKTRIQIALLVGDMIKKTKEGQVGVYVISSHRLLLNKQLMDEYQALCIECGLPINVLYIGSARQDDKAVYDRYFNHGINAQTFEQTFTTSGDEVEDFYKKTIASKRHLIIVSTYHSFGRLSHIDSIDICTYDEAHNTTQDDFRANIEPILPKIQRNFFFTATQKTCKVYGHGMENKEIYGDILCDIGPMKMIDAGEIIRPRIMAMMLDDKKVQKGIVSNKNQTMLVETIKEAFIKSREKVKEHSVDPDHIGSKLLVSFVGSDELALVQNSEDFREWCNQNNIKVFSFSSKHGTYSDFEQEERNKVYESMRDLKDEDDCILLHIDILTEGIDLPSITAVLLLRHLNEIKLFQTLGRALRLTKPDRKRLYAGEIAPKEYDKYLKPYAYLILPMHFEEMDTSSDDMRETIQKVIKTYGIPVEEFLPPEDFKSRDIEALDPVTNARKISKLEKKYPLLTVVDDFIIDEFEKGLPEDPQQKYDAIMNALKEAEDA